MSTPIQGQTPVSTPPVPQGVGNPAGTPVVAPTRMKDKDGGASGSLGTFGVRTYSSEQSKPTSLVSGFRSAYRSSRASPRCSRSARDLVVLFHAVLMSSQGGVIMDVVNAQQARIAEEAGACAVMALERVPADIRAEGGVARMVRGLLVVVDRTRTRYAERPKHDQRDRRCRHHSSDGQSAYRSLR